MCLFQIPLFSMVLFAMATLLSNLINALILGFFILKGHTNVKCPSAAK